MMPLDLASLEMKTIQNKLYYAYFMFLNRPNAFNDVNQLNEVDRLHTKIFIRNPDDLDRFRQLATQGTNK